MATGIIFSSIKWVKFKGPGTIPAWQWQLLTEWNQSPFYGGQGGITPENYVHDPWPWKYTSRIFSCKSIIVHTQQLRDWIITVMLVAVLRGQTKYSTRGRFNTLLHWWAAVKRLTLMTQTVWHSGRETKYIMQKCNTQIYMSILFL